MRLILILHNVAMIAADTTRTKYYLDELIKSELQPNYILLLLNSDSSLLPGQENKKSENEIIALLKNANVQFDISANNEINSDEVIAVIESRLEQVVIFSGFGGVLLDSFWCDQ